MTHLTYVIPRAIARSNPPLNEEVASLAGERSLATTSGSLVTYFRKGKVQKFFRAGDDLLAKELDFMSAAEALECEAPEKKKKIPETYFDLLDRNKDAFVLATTEDGVEPQTKKGRDSTVKMLRTLKAIFKNTKQLTEEQEEYLKKVISQLEEGGLPKQTIKTALKAVEGLKSDMLNQMKVPAVLQVNIPAGLLLGHYVEDNPRAAGKREVILSMYLSE